MKRQDREFLIALAVIIVVGLVLSFVILAGGCGE